MATETRTVHFKIDPALAAYLEWLDAERLEFDLHTFDLFTAGYRAAQQRPADQEAGRE